jgi:hypothetical protein
MGCEIQLTERGQRSGSRVALDHEERMGLQMALAILERHSLFADRLSC